ADQRVRNPACRDVVADRRCEQHDQQGPLNPGHRKFSLSVWQPVAAARGSGCKQPASSRAGRSYGSAAAIAAKTASSLMPASFTDAMMTTAISAAIRPYSIAVTPSS